MSERRNRLIFQVPKTEKQKRFRKVLDKLKALKIELNQPFVYRNELCKAPNQFIRQYSDGNTILIEQNQQDSSERVLLVISYDG